METVNLCTWRPSTVKLHDGREVLSDSQEWLQECLARRVLKMATREARRQWLDAWEKRHGKDSRVRLERHIIAVWEAQKVAQSAQDAA